MRYAFLVVFLLASLSLSCGDGDSEPVPTTTPASTQSFAATPSPVGPTQTGIPEVDAIIAALRSGDPEELRPLIRFSKQTCVSSGLGLPLCSPGQPEGTLVDTFMVGLCEGEFHRPDEMDSIVSFLSGWRVYGIYRAPSAPPVSLAPGVQYVVVTYVDSSGYRSAGRVEIADGNIVQAASSCPPVPPEQYVVELGLTDAVLPPQADESGGGNEQDPAEAAATAVAAAGGFQTPQETIAAYAEAWLAPFLGDCDALTAPQAGSCLAADRQVNEAGAYYRVCRPGVGACLLVRLAGGDAQWTVSSVTAYGGPTDEQLVP